MYTALYMPSLRTQIYLTSEQRTRLDALRRREHRSLAELIRAAIDDYLAKAVPDTREALDATFGALPDLTVPSRDEWDRG
jgi:predicted DNA-binding protein